MSPMSADARAVVAAVDRLTTQVKELAAAQPTPADEVSTPVVGDPFPAGTCDASTLGVSNRHLGPCLLRLGHDGPVHRGPDGETWATVVATADGSPTTTPDDGEQTCPTPATHNWGCGCPTDEAPAAHTQALRWARRESLLVLLTRVQHGRTLTDNEARALREHVETEMRDADTARAVAAGNKRHVQLLVPELEQAQAAIDRVRAIKRAPQRSQFNTLANAQDNGWDAALHAVLAALDGTERPKDS